MKRTPINSVRHPHLTMATVVAKPGKAPYAFAVLDDGVQAYVPTAVLLATNITDADVGEGFYGILTATPDRETAFFVSGIAQWDRDIYSVPPRTAEDDQEILAKLGAIENALDALWTLLGYEEDVSSSDGSAAG